MFKQELLTYKQFKALWPNVDVPNLPFDMPQGDWFCLSSRVDANDTVEFSMAVDYCEVPKTAAQRENW